VLIDPSLVICFSGRSRDATVIIEQQTAGIVGHSARAIAAMEGLKADAIEMKNAFAEPTATAPKRYICRQTSRAHPM
jgi:D-glycero-alpha-D-manno-heptose-7-phosphate kinase